MTKFDPTAAGHAPTRAQMTELLNLALKFDGMRGRLAEWLGKRAALDLTLCLDAAAVANSTMPELDRQVINDEHLVKRLGAVYGQAQVLINAWGPSPDLDYLAQALCHAAQLAASGELTYFDAWASAHAAATDILQGPGQGESWLENEVFPDLWVEALKWLNPRT